MKNYIFIIALCLVGCGGTRFVTAESETGGTGNEAGSTNLGGEGNVANTGGNDSIVGGMAGAGGDVIATGGVVETGGSGGIVTTGGVSTGGAINTGGTVATGGTNACDACLKNQTCLSNKCEWTIGTLSPGDNGIYSYTWNDSYQACIGRGQRLCFNSEIQAAYDDGWRLCQQGWTNDQVIVTPADGEDCGGDGISPVSAPFNQKSNAFCCEL